MSRAKSIVISIGAVLVLLPGAAHAQAPFSGMKLLTRDAGWAVRGNQLYWTEDFGQHWREITPPGVAPRGPAEMADVFFLNTSNGWALLREARPKGGWEFDVVSTEDGGATWSSPDPLPYEWGCPTCSLGERGTIDFADPVHGWADLSVGGVAPSRPGVLMATADGGKSWTVCADGLEIEARLSFTSGRVGWAAGGPLDSDLYVTRDAGSAWERVTPIPPKQVGTPVSIETSSQATVPKGGRGVLPAYGLPVFEGKLRGYLPVNYVGWTVGQATGPETLVIYETRNGGVTWNPIRVLATRGASAAGATVPVAIADSAIFFPAAYPNGQVAVESSPLAGVPSAPAAAPTPRGVLSLSFVDGQRGWALRYWPVSSIEATSDAGAVWADITPGPRAPKPPPSNEGAVGPDRVRQQAARFSWFRW